MIMQLLGGISAQRFFVRHWQQKPLLDRHAIPDFNGILQTPELFRLARLLTWRGLRLDSRTFLLFHKDTLLVDGETFITPRSARPALVDWSMSGDWTMSGTRGPELCEFL